MPTPRPNDRSQRCAGARHPIERATQWACAQRSRCAPARLEKLWANVPDVIVEFFETLERDFGVGQEMAEEIPACGQLPRRKVARVAGGTARLREPAPSNDDRAECVEEEGRSGQRALRSKLRLRGEQGRAYAQERFKRRLQMRRFFFEPADLTCRSDFRFDPSKPAPSIKRSLRPSKSSA